VAIPEVVIVLCPNHTVPPPIVSVWPDGRWLTPLGAVEVDQALVARLRAEWPRLEAETEAHEDEHAVELHLPILQRLRQGKPLRLVPIVVAAPSEADLRALGQAIARAIQGRDDVLIVASTDMNHQEPAAVSRAKDQRALDAVLALDPGRLLRTCADERITMCGVRPTAAAIEAATALGATTATLARYGHSGEVSGDDRRVVGYAGVVIP
jgi:MEMO1 family protein